MEIQFLPKRIGKPDRFGDSKISNISIKRSRFFQKHFRFNWTLLMFSYVGLLEKSFFDFNISDFSKMTIKQHFLPFYQKGLVGSIELDTPKVQTYSTNTMFFICGFSRICLCSHSSSFSNFLFFNFRFPRNTKNPRFQTLFFMNALR